MVVAVGVGVGAGVAVAVVVGAAPAARTPLVVQTMRRYSSALLGA